MIVRLPLCSSGLVDNPFEEASDGLLGQGTSSQSLDLFNNLLLTFWIVDFQVLALLDFPNFDRTSAPLVQQFSSSSFRLISSIFFRQWSISAMSSRPSIQALRQSPFGESVI